MIENVLEALDGFFALALSQENASDLKNRFGLPAGILLEGFVDFEMNEAGDGLVVLFHVEITFPGLELSPHRPQVDLLGIPLQKLGVFASRSPFRPNPIGLSVVRNLGSQTINSQLTLKVGGIDLVDETPVLDIKPYLAYADAVSQARSGFATEKPGACWDVNFTDSALEALSRYQSTYPNLKAFIVSVLQQDPRPAWRARGEDDKQYGMMLYDLNIKWLVTDGHIEVREIRPSERND